MAHLLPIWTGPPHRTLPSLPVPDCLLRCPPRCRIVRTDSDWMAVCVRHLRRYVPGNLSLEPPVWPIFSPPSPLTRWHARSLFFPPPPPLLPPPSESPSSSPESTFSRCSPRDCLG